MTSLARAAGGAARPVLVWHGAWRARRGGLARPVLVWHGRGAPGAGCQETGALASSLINVIGNDRGFWLPAAVPTLGARRAVRAVLALAAVAIMVATGVGWGKLRKLENGIVEFSTPLLGKGGDDGALDILLVGLDSRTDAHGNPLSQHELSALHAGDDVSTNTDTIILVRIPNSGKSATAISVPRDSYVEAPGLGKTKINGVYGQTKEAERAKLVQSGVSDAEADSRASEAGREALIKTVADLTGVTVDHYAEIGLLGFALLTDAVGGVNVCLKGSVYEPLSGADFPAGPQKLNGPKALSFVRQRHDLPRGDLDRVVRQQAVMASLTHQMISGRTLSSPAALDRLQQAIQRSVVLSAGWDIMDFVKQLQKLASGNVAFATIPVLDESGWSDDGMQSVVRVDPAQVRDWVRGLLTDQSQGKTEQRAYAPSKTTVDVLNDSDIDGLAGAVSEVLINNGFTGGAVGNNDGGHVTRSQVQTGNADDPGAQSVSKQLGGLPIVANPALATGTVRVVVTGDYTGPGSGLDGTAAAGPDGGAAPGSDGGAAPAASGVAGATAGPTDSSAPPPSPILTAGSDKPECVS